MSWFSRHPNSSLCYFVHFFCAHFSTNPWYCTHNISYINGSIIEWNKSQITHVCLYGKPNYFWLINGIGVWSHSHAPAHAMLKIHMWYVARLKHWLVSPLAHASFIFHTVTHFCISLIICSLCLYSNFYLVLYSYFQFFLCLLPVEPKKLNP